MSDTDTGDDVSVDTYRGSSLAKRIALFMLWADTSLAREQDYTRQDAAHLVLTSREFLESRFFQSHGHLGQLIGVERVESAALSAAMVAPWATVHHGTLGDIVHGLKRLDNAHLDFCAGLTSETIPDIAAVAEKIRDSVGRGEGRLSVTLLKGRERKHNGGVVPLPRRVRRRVASHAPWLRPALRGDVVDIPMALRAVAASVGCRTDRSFRDVGGLWRAVLLRVLLTVGWGIRLRHTSMVIYHSREPGHRGSPMMTVTYRICGSKRLICPTEDMAEFASNITEVPLRREDQIRFIVKATRGRFGPECFGLSPGTVAAWKAHVTRGTYAVAS